MIMVTERKYYAIKRLLLFSFKIVPVKSGRLKRHR
jgi:hypothetical protein